MIQLVSKRIVDGQGRVVLPKSVRRKMDIHPDDRVVITVRHGEMMIEKWPDHAGEIKMCYVTGIESTKCQPFSGGIDLSEEAALLLLKEYKSKQ